MLRLMLILLITTSFGAAINSDFQLIIQGRCVQWGLNNNVTGLDCVKVWEDFTKIFQNKSINESCKMNPDLYDPWVNNLFLKQPQLKKPFLWSTEGQSAVQLCRATGFCDNLEKTLAGELMNELDWCDVQFAGGDIYKTNCSCVEGEVVDAFWISASRKFAQFIKGNLGILLNGSDPRPFQNDSFMAKIEIPELKSPRITSATVYMVHHPTENPLKPACNSDSVSDLANIMKQKGIPFSCVENAPFIYHYYCSKESGLKECSNNGMALNYGTSLVTTGILIAFMISN